MTRGCRLSILRRRTSALATVAAVLLGCTAPAPKPATRAGSGLEPREGRGEVPPNPEAPAGVAGVPVVAAPAAGLGAPSQSDLANLMRTTINPAVTRISFQLFHDANARSDGSFEKVAEQATVLQGAVEEILRCTPPLFHDNDRDFRELAVSLRYYANGLQASAYERSAEESVLWFWHVKNTCDSCHKVYRFGEQDPIR